MSVIAITVLMVGSFMMALLLKIRGWIKTIAQWLWERPAVLAGLVGLALGAFFMYRSRRNKIASLKDAVEVQKAKASIAGNQAKADALESRANEKSEEIRELEKEIAASKRRVVEIHENTTLEHMSDDEVAKMFSDSGL